MGDARKDALRVEFDSRIKLEFHGAAVTSDAGLVAYRELDEVLGLTEMGEAFRDSRRGKNTQDELVGLLRQSVYSRLAGYEGTNDAERLAVDPAMRQVIGVGPEIARPPRPDWRTATSCASSRKSIACPTMTRSSSRSCSMPSSSRTSSSNWPSRDVDPRHASATTTDSRGSSRPYRSRRSSGCHPVRSG